MRVKNAIRRNEANMPHRLERKRVFDVAAKADGPRRRSRRNEPNFISRAISPYPMSMDSGAPEVGMAEAMVGPGFVRAMAAYNAEMNRRLYAAAARLSDAERRRDRGAFWGSIHGTLCHLLWGDRQWMSRFAGWAGPGVPVKDSPRLIEDFGALRTAREQADADLVAWAAGVDEVWLAQDQVWFSGAAGRELRKPRGLLMAHLFNHQTHHRGQAHAMLTAAGERAGDTDLFLIV